MGQGGPRRRHQGRVRPKRACRDSVVSNSAVSAADVCFGHFRKYRRNAVMSALANRSEIADHQSRSETCHNRTSRFHQYPRTSSAAKGDLGCLFALGLHSGRHKLAEPEMWAASLFVRDDEVIQ